MTNTSACVPFTGMVPVEDTELYVTDTGGHGRPVIYLNGGSADGSHWRRVIADLGTDDFRHITFDERARGRSGTSSDYSFAACLRDITAVMQARDVQRPILVGWSYGASLAAKWAADHPGELPGIVLVDGAMPYGLTGEEGQAQLRSLFKRMRWFLPIGAKFGLAGRMSWQEHAENNIEANEIFANCAPTLEAITCPTRYVIGTGGNLGTSAKIMAEVRDSLLPVLERNPKLQVSAQVPSNHSKILSRDHAAVAKAVHEIVSLDQLG